MNFLKYWYITELSTLYKKVKKILYTNSKKYYIKILYVNLNEPLYGHNLFFERIVGKIIRWIHFVIIIILFLSDSFISIFFIFLWAILPILPLIYFINILV